MLIVGIGCKRGTSKEFIAEAVNQTFADYQLFKQYIIGAATSEAKSHEIGLLEYCNHYSLPLILFPSDMLAMVSVPNPSRVVDKNVKTASVAEAAALLAIQSLINQAGLTEDSRNNGTTKKRRTQRTGRNKIFGEFLRQCYGHLINPGHLSSGFSQNYLTLLENQRHQGKSYFDAASKHFLDSNNIGSGNIDSSNINSNKRKLLTSTLLVPKQIYKNTVTVAVASTTDTKDIIYHAGDNC
jgi:Cobalamin synthesis G C-terminus